MSENKNRSAYIFGLILVVVGLIFLLNTLGIATFRIWYFIIKFWPLILIIIGLNMILKKSKLWWIIPILVLVIFVGAIFMPEAVMRRFNTDIFIMDSNNGERAGVYQEDKEYDNEITNFDIELIYGANRLHIDRVRDNDNLYDLDLDYRNAQPNIYYKMFNNKAELKIEQSKKINIGLNSEIWRVGLSGRVPINLNLKAGAGDLILDLKELQVNNLQIDAGLGQLDIKYPDRDNKTIINAGAGNIKLSIPSQTALRIEANSVINNNNFEETGLIKLYKNVYQSKNYGEVQHRIDIKISTSAGNINVEHN